MNWTTGDRQQRLFRRTSHCLPSLSTSNSNNMGHVTKQRHCITSHQRILDSITASLNIKRSHKDSDENPFVHRPACESQDIASLLVSVGGSHINDGSHVAGHYKTQSTTLLQRHLLKDRLLGPDLEAPLLDTTIRHHDNRVSEKPIATAESSMSDEAATNDLINAAATAFVACAAVDHATVENTATTDKASIASPCSSNGKPLLGSDSSHGQSTVHLPDGTTDRATSMSPLSVYIKGSTSGTSIHWNTFLSGVDGRVGERGAAAVSSGADAMATSTAQNTRMSLAVRSNNTVVGSSSPCTDDDRELAGPICLDSQQGSTDRMECGASLVGSTTAEPVLEGPTISGPALATLMEVKAQIMAAIDRSAAQLKTEISLVIDGWQSQ
ncbi:hypothetical protein BASA62_000171 [Batrachochytrium salamandrivorans]|nr:hypothetical protein BASA62_000171 [Batrachochytrium salamandrivorans]